LFWKSLFLILGAYFSGGFPTAYLVGRALRGIDIREHGTGNVGGSNVWFTVARWAMFPVALFDMAKGALPAWLALGPLDMGHLMAILAGLSAAVGHAWSPYLGFTGGRALATMLGALGVLFPRGFLVQLLIMGLGFVTGIELLTSLGLLLLPVLSFCLDRPEAVTWGTLAIVLLTAVKRAEANRLPPPPGEDRWRVLWRRLWLDRDIPSHEEWVRRKPGRWEAPPRDQEGR
jgi:glycerol-3-phosphate acyltransferase PlsY